QLGLNRWGARRLATDWGHRLLSEESALYDPLSYHHGSVWPLFTGWVAMAGYRYGRPHVAYQALTANALLRSATALGHVTELLSAQFFAAFGRPSHHQAWSEPMCPTPILRGLLGIEVGDAGRSLRFAPQLPADWDHAAARNVAVGGARYDLEIVRARERDTLTVARRPGKGQASPLRFTLAPSYPLDARV